MEILLWKAARVFQFKNDMYRLMKIRTLQVDKSESATELGGKYIIDNHNLYTRRGNLYLLIPILIPNLYR